MYGHGDANLPNYLHDGGTVRLVDFEDCGRSDRAWELAIFTEHLSVHGRGQVPAELALGHFETTAAERARIREYRRLLATANWEDAASQAGCVKFDTAGHAVGGEMSNRGGDHH